jgi:hypothetical protein
MAKRSPVRKKLAPKIHTTIRLRPEIIEMCRLAAEYHKVGYQTYLQWLVEDALKNEAKYYGWKTPAKKYVVRRQLSPDQQRDIRRIMRIAERKVQAQE